MIVALFALAVGQAAPASPPAWTWTLYEDAPLVLANEVPDTASLRATLECEPGSGVAQVTVYGREAASGMARITAGEATALAEAQAGRAGAVKAPLRIDHPAFAAFLAEGRMSLALGEDRRQVEVQSEHLAKLRRFSELCAG